MKPKRPSPRSSPALRDPSGPSCRGGASSLLRLSRADAGPLPSVGHLQSWVKRAAAMFGASPRVRPPAFSVSEYGVGSTG